MQRGGHITALTFGSQLPAGKHTYPTSPSWMVYSGDEQSCTQNTPLLIHQDDFCHAFLAEARVFRQALLTLCQPSCRSPWSQINALMHWQLEAVHNLTGLLCLLSRLLDHTMIIVFVH